MGLPGLRAVEHVGITVPSLEGAVRFFVDVIGCELAFSDGPIANDRAFMRERLNVHPDASLRYCFLTCGNGPNLEIFEYDSPDQDSEPPRNSDVGGHHLCFYVDDISAAVEHLRQNGVRLLGEINVIFDGPAAGSRWIYFLAPWGLQLELVSYPGGKGAPGSPARRLWTPSRS